MDFFLVNNAIHNSSPSVVWLVLVIVYDRNPILWLILVSNPSCALGQPFNSKNPVTLYV